MLATLEAPVRGGRPLALTMMESASSARYRQCEGYGIVMRYRLGWWRKGGGLAASKERIVGGRGVS